MKNLFILSILLTFSKYSYGNSNYGKVILLKGEASQLSPHQKYSQILKNGDVLVEDTSILTHEKSIVRVEFSDKSIMTIGPNSKVRLGIRN